MSRIEIPGDPDPWRRLERRAAYDVIHNEVVRSLGGGEIPWQGDFGLRVTMETADGLFDAADLTYTVTYGEQSSSVVSGLYKQWLAKQPYLISEEEEISDVV